MRKVIERDRDKEGERQERETGRECVCVRARVCVNQKRD